MELRFLKPLKTKKNQWYWWVGEISYSWEDIEDRNRKQDCYFGVNPRAEDRGDATAVTVCRCIFADFDHTTPDAASATIEEKGLPQPTVLVNSGHGAHAYWRLEDAIDVQQWRAIQRGLIELLGCDDKVKDPPRIMRLPGTKHVAKHKKGAQPVWCEIVYNNMTRHDVEDIVRVLPVVDVDDSNAAPLPQGDCAPLPAWCNAFLVGGTGEGDRNAKAFDVACAMAGNGWPVEDARKMIVAAAERCTPQLSQGEALSAVKSAYSKQRTPPRQDLSHLLPMTAWQWALPQAEPEPIVEIDDEDAIQVGEPLKVTQARPFFSNVIESTDKEGNTTTHAKHVEDITSALHEATGQWPRRSGGILFVPGDTARPGELPPDTGVRHLTKPDELFAWVHGKTTPFWPDGKRCSDPIDGGGRSSVKRNEFFEHLRETVRPAYEGAEILPHEPPADGVWYAPCVLARSPRSLLDEFIERLNWETDLDRSLMMAAALTLFWGGAPGSRPAFVVTSQYGAGAGKTTTTDMLCELVGGRMELGSNEKPEDFTKRLLSDAGMRRRAVLLDNVKQRMDAQGIEAMITAKEIGGHRMYHGHATRPNRMTWFVTANAPRLSHDLAERSYNIRIGAQRTDAAWIEGTAGWIRQHRVALIASILGVLQDPPVCEIAVRDRWSAWQTAVLSRVPRGDEVAAAMAERRQAMDADRDDADEIATVVRGLLRHQGHMPDTCYAWIHRRVLADALNVWEGDPDKNRRGTISFINNRVGNGSLKQMKERKVRGERGYAWMGADLDHVPASYQIHITELPAGLEAADLEPPMVGGED